jgi:putative hemolysin
MSYEYREEAKGASRVRKAVIAVAFFGAFGLGVVSSVAFLIFVPPDDLFTSRKEPEISSRLNDGSDSECRPSDGGCPGGTTAADATAPLGGPNLDVITPAPESSDNQPESTFAAQPADRFPTRSIPDSGANAPSATRSPTKTAAKSVKTEPKPAKSPASKHCHSLGGRIESRNGLHGRYNLCQLPDGRVIEEWRFYRMEQPKTGPADDKQ